MQAKITFRNTSKSLDGSKVELFYVLYLDRSHQVHLTEKSNYYSSKRASMESKEKHFPHSFVKDLLPPYYNYYVVGDLLSRNGCSSHVGWSLSDSGLSLTIWKHLSAVVAIATTTSTETHSSP